MTGLAKLGFPVDPAHLKFGGNAATTNWRSITSYTVNIPSAKTAAQALAVCAKVTPSALTKAAGGYLGAGIAIQNVFLSAFKP